MLGEFDDDVVAEDAGHDEIDVAREHHGDVLGGFAFAEADVGGCEVNSVPAEEGHAGLEGNAGAQRRFLEYHRERLVLER